MWRLWTCSALLWRNIYRTKPVNFQAPSGVAWTTPIFETTMMATMQMNENAANQTFLLIAENFSVSLLARIAHERTRIS